MLARSLAPSATIEVHALTMRMRAQGERVVSLSVGEPDFPPPQAVVDAVSFAMAAGSTRYTEVSGTAQLRTAIAKDLLSRKRTRYAPDQIVVANGAKQAVSSLRSVSTRIYDL